MRALDGIRVLEFGTFITGPLAAMLLADLGAEVIKIERPGQGDPFRTFDAGTYSPQFQAHNRNKRSVTIDYARPEGLSLVRTLVETADVVITNSRPGVSEKLGIGYAALHELNPRLVYCSITGFGPTGPYAKRPALDNVGQALSGWMSRHRVGDDPRVAGPAISDPVTSYQAVMGILAALFERSVSGQGHLVEVNMLEATLGLVIEPLAAYLASGQVSSVHHRGAMSQAYNLTCRDGKRIGLHTSSIDKFWKVLCAVVGREEWIAKYPTRMDRVNGYDEIAGELKNIFAQRDQSDWIAVLDKAGLPFAPENDLKDLESDPQVKHLEVFHELDHPQHGKLRAPHRAIRIDGSRDVAFRAPPELGEHTEEILREAGVDEAQLREYRTGGII